MQPWLWSCDHGVLQCLHCIVHSVRDADMCDWKECMLCRLLSWCASGGAGFIAGSSFSSIHIILLSNVNLAACNSYPVRVGAMSVNE